jgi:hypothetical protein
VPNDVLKLEDYLIAIDPAKSPEEREAAFQRRANWLRGLGVPYTVAINNMVTEFGKLGVVEARPGVKDDGRFPPVMLVESNPDLPEPAQAQAVAGPEAAASPEGGNAAMRLITKVNRFPHGIRPRGAGAV